MRSSSPYDRFFLEYDHWFDQNPLLYELELKAVRCLIPQQGCGVEIGVGTGRFASPLGIPTGVEPSGNMGRMAMDRGVEVVRGIAESLPFLSGSFDYALFVTVVCFFDHIQRAMDEAFRVLKRSGEIVVGFVDKNSRMGMKYSDKKENSRFYRNAVFYTADEILETLKGSGFSSFRIVQTLIDDQKTGDFSTLVTEGYGEGSFIVINGKKSVSV